MEYHCPKCGEHRKTSEYALEGNRKKGVYQELHSKIYFIGFIFKKKMKIDFYKCKTCGETWSGIPYRIY